MKNFSNPSDFQLDKSDYEVMSKLATNPEFIRWREIVDQFQMRRAYNFLSGMATPADIEKPVDYYRGGYDLMVKALRIVDNADQMLEELNQENDET